ncbi:lysozyme [Vibrio sp. S4M6]|nr:lysozyme [Vibrio sinus]MCL9783648.1 lysozyme [Vibrio sinus]
MKHVKKIVCSVSAVIALLVTGTVPNNIKVSPQGLELIGNAEQCRLTPYKCPAGLITNGIGNTHQVSPKPITLEKVAQDWSSNIESAQNCLAATTNIAALSQGQIDAFTSFIFNVGCTRYQHNSNGSETRIYKKLKAGKYDSACRELRFWVYGDGKRLKGLVIRRKKEMKLCLGSIS